MVWARTKKTWAAEEDFVEDGKGGYGVRTVYGKTVGMLGYGHIGRETARLFRAFGVDVIAATSSGAARPDDGYILPGTGDKEGSIPSEYYQTTHRASFHAFLARSDILICSVPSTNATRGLLSVEELGLLPDGAVVINVGRGDLIDTNALLKALDNNIAGAALDVTSPEPLPANHLLFSHPRCIITPHLSGTVENEHDEVVKLCLSSVERMRNGEAPWGIVDVEKGY
ncbi:hypothetical protein QFC22_006248 [Naganishia vaughanmartiniae]|uniref:Uncharacterized protein n=1 Tax=Naganishia vaughanmartiniae TaxID=1424756 RepID=A0ACC2WN37_9TREE|nr:hypothetical protein QFC22_006248 [Naganishia vaughanmartiniae]